MTKQLATLDQLLTVLRRTGDVSGTTGELLFGVLRSNIEDLHHAEPIIRYDAHEGLSSSAMHQICTELEIDADYFRETVEIYYLNYRVDDWLLANDDIYTKFCDGFYVGLHTQVNQNEPFLPCFLVACEYEYVEPEKINKQVLPAAHPPLIVTNCFRRR